jgi:hypothetical protein
MTNEANRSPLETARQWSADVVNDIAANYSNPHPDDIDLIRQAAECATRIPSAYRRDVAVRQAVSAARRAGGAL